MKTQKNLQLLKKTVALLCASAVMIACFTFLVSAITAEKRSSVNASTVCKGGQEIVITTGDALNNALPGKLFHTKVSITLSILYRDQYCESVTGDSKTIQVLVYKKVGQNWAQQGKLGGKYFCNAYSGVLSEALELPGKNIDYKLVIVPETQGDVQLPSDMIGIKLDVHNGVLADEC